MSIDYPSEIKPLEDQGISFANISVHLNSKTAYSMSRLDSFLQDMAVKNEFMVDSVNVIDRNSQRQADKHPIPVLSAVVRGTGNLAAIQLYINQVKTEQRLLSVNRLSLQELFYRRPEIK